MIIGLTGSIGMGKTTVASMFKHLGAAICDSDALVHKLLSSGGAAVEKVAIHFPSTRSEQGINRKMLATEVFGNPEKLALLEGLIHPLVIKAQARFIRQQSSLGKKWIVLDIPLLFETGAQKRCHKVVVVSAPAFIQRQRVMKRGEMTREKLAAILKRQMPNQTKCRQADVVVQTGQGKALSFRQARKFLQKLLKEKRCVK